MLLTETADQRIYHKRTLQGNLSGNYPEYAREQLQAMEDGTANLMHTDRSVHSFVGKEKSILGNVYKPASWKAPHTKHVRFTFQKPEDLRKLLDPNFVDWAGGYLYLR